jgi:hypothetical protein
MTPAVTDQRTAPKGQATVIRVMSTTSHVPVRGWRGGRLCSMAVAPGSGMARVYGMETDPGSSAGTAAEPRLQGRIAGERKPSAV